MSDSQGPDDVGSSSGVRRRWLLRSGAAGATVSMAGCLGLEPPSTSAATVKERALETGLTGRKSVVRVHNGTGWVIDEDHALTCSHVVPTDEVDVTTDEGETTTGTVIGRHDRVDLAVLEIDLPVSPLPLDEDPDFSGNPRTPLVQVGHPVGVGSWVVSFGRYERLEGDQYLADLPCAPGNSGSPVLSMAGSVVGTTTGTTVRIVGGRNRDSPDRLFEEFPGKRVLATVATPESITHCLDHLAER